ncbi:hydrogenase accessory protein HypB [Halothece sp. PCC 7418]|uniref:hydrogenase nickel incorporation protein HypB n=1 Tax=Halothece sp. (strain PCC 7418) TaxID=65093 RepID=UPI0002A075F9|nr:hydrogenase nickel incorporation protein HypB [Halothece sp. PCC 7418]AFZ43475.1 hydrogenase accessory protein HypB [Halothece sp. PCC 7418]
MCENCGCANTSDPIHIHTHEDHAPSREIHVHEAILAKNEHLAHHLREKLHHQAILTLNFLSSPGSGKTSLIERTLTELSEHFSIAVVVGDLETDNDAQRLRGKGGSVVQITTGSVCHLEANMVESALTEINLDGVQLLLIENVGNLVCPAAYDLGEDLRVGLLSATEGEDKPLKYPTLFKTADVVVLNKMDLAEAVGFNRDLAIENIQKIAPQAEILELSARSGAGLSSWYDYLKQQYKSLFLVSANSF